MDQFDRITQHLAGISSANSYFDVEHKSGRISRFKPVWPDPGLSPDVWYLVQEWDRQGNCIGYEYAQGGLRGSNRERLLSRIRYTGKMVGDTCSFGSDPPRSVNFNYVNRPDNRTTYRFGVASPMTVRLDNIVTAVDTTPSRKYSLSYRLSNATSRSLLDKVSLCAGPGTPCLNWTQFNYQDDAPSFSRDPVSLSGQGRLGQDWTIKIAPDFDGDGKAEHLYDHQTSGGIERTLEFSCRPTQPFQLDTNWWLGLDNPADAIVLEWSSDFDYDGRAKILGTSAGNFALGTLKCDGSFSIQRTDLPLSTSYASAIDIDGDGRLDLVSGSTIFRHRTTNATQWAGQYDAIPFPSPPPFLGWQSTRDLNGDGLMDFVWDDATQNPTHPTQISFLSNITGQLATYLLTDLGGPSGSFSRVLRKSGCVIDSGAWA